MTKPSWQLNLPINAIVFDCEGTLTSLEGMDFLARNNGVGESIRTLTTKVMAKKVVNPCFYQQRLDLILPRREQIFALGYQYFAHQVSAAAEIIQLLQRLNKAVFLVSTAVNPAVRMFGELLQIPAEHVYAVDLRFDQQGNFLHYDESSPLAQSTGKSIIIKKLKDQYEHVIQVGNGESDLATRHLVTRFIGYHTPNRKNIAPLCDFYIKTPSLVSLLPLVLTETEYTQLNPQEKILYANGLAALQQGDIQVPGKNSINPIPVLDQSLQFE